jgi:prepilin-type N-terminal cleavage/methylation domain-containing protein
MAASAVTPLLSNHQTPLRQQKGYSIIELSIALAIISIILVTALAGVQRILRSNNTNEDLKNINLLASKLTVMLSNVPNTAGITQGNLANLRVFEGFRVDVNVVTNAFNGNITVAPNTAQLGICRPEFISALVYQSLIPRNCVHCKIPAEKTMSASELLVYESNFFLDTSSLFVASDDGCPSCKPANLATIRGGHAGVKGVTVAAEIIQPDLQLLEYLSKGEDLKAFDYWRNLQTTSFSEPDMLGKPSWGHALYDMSLGNIDPYHFQKVFGSPLRLKASLSELNHG